MVTEQKQNIVWSQVVISSLLTALLSIGVGIAIFHYTSKSPQLTYTIFPVSAFRAPNKSLTIYNVQIENGGNKEADDVQVSFTFPSSSNVADYNVDLSAKTIKYSISDTNDLTNAVFTFPLLNPTESCKFSFLAENAEAGNVEVDLRGKGAIGEMRKIKSESRVSSVLPYTIIAMAVIVGMISTYIALTLSKTSIKDAIRISESLRERSK